MSEQRDDLWQRGREIVLAAPQAYIDVDIEADGIAGRGSMLSIGSVAASGEEYYSEIRPAHPDSFLPEHRQFCEEHGLEHERLMDEARDRHVVMREFHDWTRSIVRNLGKRAVFSAFNAAFDWAFVDLYFAQTNLDNPYGVAPFDLKSLAIVLTRDWDWDHTKKSQLPHAIIPAGDFTHHALDDAKYQQLLHFGMAALTAQR